MVTSLGPLIIGLCGAEGAGKSTVASMLNEEFDAQIIPFASPLKNMLKALGVPPDNLYGTPKEKEAPLELLGGQSARYALQTLGTEWGRTLISENLWAKAWELSVAKAIASKIKTGSSAPIIIVADDVRFANEVKAIHGLGGKIWKVRRPSVENIDDTLHPSQKFWALENDLDIHNTNSDPESLRQQIVGAAYDAMQVRCD